MTPQELAILYLEQLRAYRSLHRTHDVSREVERLAHSNPERAVTIAVEIIHRGASRGWDSFDVMSPLGDVLAKSGREVVRDVEEQAKHSIAVRRVLWRLKRQVRRWTFPDSEDVELVVSRRVGSITSS